MLVNDTEGVEVELHHVRLTWPPVALSLGALELVNVITAKHAPSKRDILNDRSQ